jgi:hypothetical protein
MAPARNFKKALLTRKVAIIAAVKRKLPSRGTIRNDFDPLEIAEIYEKNGAAAGSVLTDEPFFGGKRQFLTRVKRKTLLPPPAETGFDLRGQRTAWPMLPARSARPPGVQKNCSGLPAEGVRDDAEFIC